jgi:uncharacterized repeat protein (TIGR03803 family)
LILSGNTLYGTAQYGGGAGVGTVFAVNTDGSGFTNLHTFTALATNSSGVYTNSEGANPSAGLVLSDRTLYGTAELGGAWGDGTVFRINTDGSGFTNLHSWSGVNDGVRPQGDLILVGNALYGTAKLGGSFDQGTVFKVNINGTSFSNLHSFTGINEGAHPFAGLSLSGDILYGTTSYGGDSGAGTVFSISFAPQLGITSDGPNVILTWPTDYSGFDYTGYVLQSTTNLVSPVWTTNFPAPSIVNGQNRVTNSISGAQQFYRLSE